MVESWGAWVEGERVCALGAALLEEGVGHVIVLGAVMLEALVLGEGTGSEELCAT